jgi:Cdc6-like AAA superfamily ATPase
MNPATNLEEAIFVFDPRQWLTGEELKHYYVDRGSSARAKMLSMLRVNHQQRSQPVKFLFTGHKGSGKTTEVNKLCEELDDSFFVVHVHFPNPADVSYVDVPLKAAMSLFKQATDDEVIKRAPAQVLGDLWEDIGLFVEKKIFGDLPVRGNGVAPREITAKLNLFGIEFESKFDTEPASRDQIRKANEKSLAEVNDKISLLSDQVRTKYGKPVLFVFEGLDKIELALAKEIFLDRSQSLTNFRASAIYLIPIGLRYTPQFSSVTRDFDSHVWLPNIKLHTRENQPYTEGEAILHDIITRRADPSLFEKDALDEIIRSSGGLIRSLIALARDAALNAAVRKAEKIGIEDARRAVKRLLGDFIAMLESRHYPILKARYEDKDLNSDDETQELLESLALLEYENDSYWCDVHPIILPEVEKRMKK